MAQLLDHANAKKPRGKSRRRQVSYKFSKRIAFTHSIWRNHMKRIIMFALMLALLLPAVGVNAQDSTASEVPGNSASILHHGSFSCRLQVHTKDGSHFDITISYQENSRGLITSASVFKWNVDWYLEASWSWHAYGVNIEVRQWDERYSKHCRASAMY